MSEPVGELGRVRWREGRRWHQGRWTGNVDQDGASLQVVEKGTGEVRSIPVLLLQRQRTGPRGGKRWEPIGMAGPAPEPVTRPRRRDRKFAGQLNLFGGDAA